MDLRITIESNHFATADAFVRSARWTDALSRGYRARLEVDVHVEDFDASVLLGSDIRLLLERPSGARRLTGIVSAVTEVGKVRSGVRLALEVTPAFDLLSLRRRSRIFQDKSVVDIVEEVLGEELGTYGRSFGNDLTGEYATREYCVQYQESDRDFVCRLLEEEGIWFCFDHSGDVEELKLRDANTSAPRVEGGEDGTIPYDTVTSFSLADREAVFAARLCAQATPTSVATRRHDWSSFNNAEGSDEEGDATGPMAERYEHGQGFSITLADFGSRYGAHDAVQHARVWRESHTSPRLRVRGSSVVTGFSPGTLFELTDHPVPEANGEHLLVSVTHHLAAPEGHDEEDTARDYHNEFEAQPKDRPYRAPRVTPRPAIPGIETAMVVGAGGEEIHTEQHGRIKVQFHWDRDGASDDHSSCWLRVAQPWAGASWGFVWTPRIGMEVVVRFEQGDPDRPLVTDALYTGANTPPYALPDEKTKSTIKSNSSLGGGGFNELRFEDKAGSEEVFQHAQRNLDEVVLNNHSTHVGAHQSNEVDKDQLQEIKGNQEETIATTQNLDVGGNRKVTVDGGFDETVTGSQTRTVKAGSTESIAGSETHEVLNGGLTELITGKETRTVTGGLTETLHDFAGLLVTGAVTETVSGSMLRKAASIKHDASASITMTGTAGIDMNGNTGISIKSPQYKTLTTEHRGTAATHSSTQPDKTSYYAIQVDLTGFKADFVKFAFEFAGSKKDVTGISVGAYGASVSLIGGKFSNDPTVWADWTAFALDMNGFRIVKSG